VGVALTMVGCTPVASELAAPPEYAPANQTKCKVKSSQLRPLIVEWPPAERVALEAQLKQALVVVRYDGCEMEVMRGCRAPAAYRYVYVPTTRQEDALAIRDEDELYASIPVFASKFEGRLKSAGRLDVRMAMVGTFQTTATRLPLAEFSGDCRGATHVVSSAIAGAFEFSAGGEAEVGGGVEVAGVGAGSKGKSLREVLNRGGSMASCDAATISDPAPPDGCGALIRIEVTPVQVPVQVASGAPAPVQAPVSQAPSPQAAAPAPAGTPGTMIRVPAVKGVKVGPNLRGDRL
jgi:hypothetical protein